RRLNSPGESGAKVRSLLIAGSLLAGGPRPGSVGSRIRVSRSRGGEWMKRLLNTLFVTTQGAYLSKEGEAVTVRVEKVTKLRVPLHTLGGIVCFGRVGCSP